jgi:uncharacterized protein
MIINIMIELHMTSEISLQGKKIIQAFAGSGLVGIISAKFFINQLDMKEVGYLEHGSIPSIAVVEEGVSKRPFRIFSNDSYVAVVNQSNISQSNLKSFVRDLYNWYLEIGAAEIIILGGLPTGRKAEAETVDYGIVVSTSDLEKEISLRGFQTVPTGIVFGSIALSLLEGGDIGIDTIAFIANCIASVPDFLAAREVVNQFANFESLKISTEYLDYRIEELREQLIEEGYDDDVDEFYDDEFDEDGDGGSGDEFLSDPSRFM